MANVRDQDSGPGYISPASVSPGNVIQTIDTPYTVDTALKRTDIETSVSLSTAIKQTDIEASSYQIDSAIELRDIEDTYTVDASIELRDIETQLNTDTALSKEIDTSFALDSAIQNDIHTSYLTDTVLKKYDIEYNYSVDTTIELRDITSTSSITAALQLERSRSLSMDSAIKQYDSIAQNYGIEIALKENRVPLSYNIDTVIVIKSLTGYNIEVPLQREDIDTSYSIDSALKKLRAYEAGHSLSTAVQLSDGQVGHTDLSVLLVTGLEAYIMGLETAVIRKDISATTHSMNTALQSSETVGMSVDAMFILVRETEYQVDTAIIQNDIEYTYTIGTALQDTAISTNLSTDTALSASVQHQFDTTTALQVETTHTFPYGVALQKDVESTHSIDSALKYYRNNTLYSVDTVIAGVPRTPFRTDVVLSDAKTRSYHISTATQVRRDLDHIIDVAVSLPATTPTIIEAVLKGHPETEMPISAPLQLEDISTAMTSDVAVMIPVSELIGIDSTIQATTNTPVMLDTTLMNTEYSHMTIDAAIFYVDTIDTAMAIDVVLTKYGIYDDSIPELHGTMERDQLDTQIERDTLISTMERDQLDTQIERDGIITDIERDYLITDLSES